MTPGQLIVPGLKRAGTKQDPGPMYIAHADHSERSKFFMKRSLKRLSRYGTVSMCLLMCLAMLFGCTPGKNGDDTGTPAPEKSDVPGSATPAPEPLNAQVSVFPVPRSMETGDVQFSVQTVSADETAEAYKTALENAGFNLGSGGISISFAQDNDIPAEGYTLSVSENGIKVSSADRPGAMNAIATLGQLCSDGKIPAVEISDSPDVAYRGVIEGFYGVAWTHEFRLDLLKFMGKYKLNTYIYAPKDDPKHRSQWRSTYTGKELEKMKELAAAAADNNVRFVYAISPGLDIKLGDGYEKDKEALFNKCESLYELGVRDFAILLDDIPTLNAQGHAMLLNDFQTGFCETHEGVSNLTAITPEFCSAMVTKYTDELAPLLNEKIMMMWTGSGVIPPSITPGDLTNINRKLNSKVFIWWNYPVNDTMSDQLFLAPCAGLSPKLPEKISGLVSNPMNQGYASLTPLFTIADFLWNSSSFDPEISIRAASKQLEPDCHEAYDAFIDMNRASVINGGKSAFAASGAVSEYMNGNRKKDNLEALSGAFKDLSDKLSLLKEKGSAELISEIEPWLNKAVAYAGMGSALMKAELAELDKNKEALKAAADEFMALRSEVKGNGRSISPDILTPFINRGLNRVSELLTNNGFTPAKFVEASTNLNIYQDYVPDNAVDGFEETFFWSSGAPAAGSYFMIDLTTVSDLKKVTLKMSAPGHTDDYMRSGVVEYSADGNNWKELGKLSGKIFEYNGNFSARYLRLRCTASQIYWLIITEFGAE